MKATKQNYYDLCEVMYNFTGQQYWLNKPTFDAQCGCNFITEFNNVLAQVRAKVDAGEVCRFPLVHLNGVDVRYKINSMDLGKAKNSHVHPIFAGIFSTLTR